MLTLVVFVFTSDLCVSFIAVKSMSRDFCVHTSKTEGKQRRSGLDAYTLRSNWRRFESVGFIMPESTVKKTSCPSLFACIP